MSYSDWGVGGGYMYSDWVGGYMYSDWGVGGGYVSYSDRGGGTCTLTDKVAHVHTCTCPSIT